jgi:hypothetical protein
VYTVDFAVSNVFYIYLPIAEDALVRFSIVVRPNIIGEIC